MAEEFPKLADWDIQIIATDLSVQVLQAAGKGLYGPYSIRNVPPAYLQKYFTATEGQYVVRPILKRYVKFSRLNLFDSLQMRTMRDVDVIFCRNVLIYFDQEVRKQIVSHYYDALAPSGSLIIGFSESLSGVNRLFRPVPWHKTFFYTKADQPLPSVVNSGAKLDLGLHAPSSGVLKRLEVPDKSGPARAGEFKTFSPTGTKRQSATLGKGGN
jgi:chemotaxis methyl-accepting protein methylase